MNPIMPSLARGTHAYRPSNQTQGSVHSLPVVNHTANLNNNSNDISDTELPPLSSPPATSPPALPSPSPSASATAFFSNNSISSVTPSASASTSAPLSAVSFSNGKHKHSAVDDESLISAPASQAVRVSKYPGIKLNSKVVIFDNHLTLIYFTCGKTI